MARLSRRAKELRKRLEDLIESQPDDRRLLDHLHGLESDEVFPGLTWFWGPKLYARNRAVFRPLIFNHFSDWMLDGRRWSRVRWASHERELESWLEQARNARDSALVRRLLRWKYSGKGWGLDNKRWNAAMLEAYDEAPSAAARAIVLNEFDDWFDLDEATAVRLYRRDPAAAPFVLRHVPASFWVVKKRQLWRRLDAAAAEAGDDDFRFALYRKRVPVKQWRQDVLTLAGSATAEALEEELEKRHPEGWNLKLAPTLLELLERRGREVMPYLRRKLPEVLSGWTGTDPRPFVSLAENRGWWDLWSASIRASANPKHFNKAVKQLLDDSALDDETRRQRLAALAGVSREWNWSGFGFARVHTLEDDLAARLYQREPDLLHGAFRPNITPRWWQGFPKLLDAALEAEDDDMVDLMASRYVTRQKFQYFYFGGSGEAERLLETAEKLAMMYEHLREEDPSVFARRAANVLTRVPAYTVHGYSNVIKTNRLARLLFVRSASAYLEEPDAVRDLVEGSDIHVQMLAYRVLARDDDRARAQAASNLDILIGTLLRPLHRKTRLPAFAALANAARSSPEAGARVLQQARAALRLPDQRYPKEELIGLIGQVLHVQPSLRRQQEQPMVYGLSETVTEVAS